MENKPKVAMLPIGPLMIEHLLIERMAALLKKENIRIAGGAEDNQQAAVPGDRRAQKNRGRIA